MTGELTRNMSSGMSASNPVESPEYRAQEKRRAWDRERKRRQRSGGKSTGQSAMSTGNVHRIPPDNADMRLSLEVKKEGLSVGRERKKGSRLLSDTRVSDEQRAIAVACGCPPDRVDAVWTEFVDYWSDIPGNRGCKLTWNGTWRNWVKRNFGKSNGHAISNHRTDPAAGRATAREAQQISAMGRAAANRLASRAPAGTNGPLPRDAGFAGGFDLGGPTKNVD